MTLKGMIPMLVAIFPASSGNRVLATEHASAVAVRESDAPKVFIIDPVLGAPDGCTLPCNAGAFQFMPPGSKEFVRMEFGKGPKSDYTHVPETCLRTCKLVQKSWPNSISCKEALGYVPASLAEVNASSERLGLAAPDIDDDMPDWLADAARRAEQDGANFKAKKSCFGKTSHVRSEGLQGC